jgi:formamidopyrimidine-DNA glycosylase
VEEKLGPDALNDRDFSLFDRRMSGRQGFVKSVLINQSAIACIGNVYADEILFQARIGPCTRVEGTSRCDRRSLLEAIQGVLGAAIAARADPDRFPKGFLTPRRELDGRCPRCRSRLEKVAVSGRDGYFCPKCQS